MVDLSPPLLLTLKPSDDCAVNRVCCHRRRSSLVRLDCLRSTRHAPAMNPSKPWATDIQSTEPCMPRLRSRERKKHPGSGLEKCTDHICYRTNGPPLLPAPRLPLFLSSLGGVRGCGRGNQIELVPPPQVRSIECKRQSVKEVSEGQSATFAVRSVNRRVALRRSTFRKGMVAIDGQDDPRATREFEADVVILHHSTTVAPGYQPVIHCGVVRQAAAILSMSGTESGMEALRTGQTATVRFRFMVRIMKEKEKEGGEVGRGASPVCVSEDAFGQASTFLLSLYTHSSTWAMFGCEEDPPRMKQHRIVFGGVGVCGVLLTSLDCSGLLLCFIWYLRAWFAAFHCCVMVLRRRSWTTTVSNLLFEEWGPRVRLNCRLMIIEQPFCLLHAYVVSIRMSGCCCATAAPLTRLPAPLSSLVATLASARAVLQRVHGARQHLPLPRGACQGHRKNPTGNQLNRA